jgi:hypothetical protein
MEPASKDCFQWKNGLSLTCKKLKKKRRRRTSKAIPIAGRGGL